MDEEAERISFKRIQIQLKVIEASILPPKDVEKAMFELEKYTLGTKRSLEDYERLSGVSFRSAALSDLATSGNLSPDMFADNVLVSLLAGYLR